MKNNPISEHYDKSADTYHLQYQEELLYDLKRDYPANYFRLRQLRQSFANKKIKNIVEVGVGEGTPLVEIAKLGIEVSGFDISKEMVRVSRNTLAKNGIDQNRVIEGDIEKPDTYSELLKFGPFDGLLAMGVMPHVTNDEQSLKNMMGLLAPGGTIFVEFRNKLFSLFTFNRNTMDFIMDDLLLNVSGTLKDLVRNNLNKRLEMSLPQVRAVHEADADVPGYDAILSKFHNPFEMLEVFSNLGFQDSRLLWYHFHPAMPFLEEHEKMLFREEAFKLEENPSDWRGMFLCSAFVIEAQKG
jgi:2-polyprenyl-3-methyl-5-hydroxy-6-metoxy-1,4-benzoquinol methylase